MNIVKRLQERDVSNAKGATLEREAVEHINSIERELQSTVADANKYNRIIAPGYKQVAADAYYEHLHTMRKSVRERVSAEMLAEIFRCMVVPAIDAVISRAKD